MSRREIAPFQVMEVLRAAQAREAAGADVIHLEVGQPSTGAPAAVRAAAAEALAADRLGYTDALGLPALRERIARHYADEYGVVVDADRIAITVGASGGCVLAFLAAFAEGARVGVCEPGYPCYRNMLTAFGVEPVPIRVGPDTGWNPTVDSLDAAGGLDGLVVAGPSNPTGTRFSAEELRRLADWCHDHDVRLVSDEIYHGIEDGRSPTAAAHPGTVVVGSFSKYFSMTGWRIGWLVVPPDLLRPVERLAQNLVICAPTLSQHGALAAFDATAELDAHVARYATNRALLIDGLARLGIDRIAPADGAFYIYADVSHLTSDSTRLCATWLDELGVATTPGVDFDPVRGHHHIRFSVAGSTDDITAALERLEGALR